MIADNGRHYLYRHISLYGKVFYIGIGTKLNKPKGFNSHSTEYSRAYCKSKRNLEWYEESKNEYRIEILLESDSYNFIKEKEKELNFDESTISKCCKNKLKKAYGFRWEYVNPNQKIRNMSKIQKKK